MNKTDLKDDEKKLIKLLKAYPHPNHKLDDHRGLIICISLSASQNGWTREFIGICEKNPDASFDEILNLIMTPERFPALEVVDDETNEDE